MLIHSYVWEMKKKIIKKNLQERKRGCVFFCIFVCLFFLNTVQVESRVIVQSFGIRLSHSVTLIPKHSNMKKKKTQRRQSTFIHCMMPSTTHTTTRRLRGAAVRGRWAGFMSQDESKAFTMMIRPIKASHKHTSPVQKQPSIFAIVSNRETGHTKLQSKKCCFTVQQQKQIPGSVFKAFNVVACDLFLLDFI